MLYLCSMFTLRAIENIFPSYYINPPDETEIRRHVNAHLYDCQVARDAYEWIERKDCPYLREAYATITYIVIGEMISDGDWNIRYDVREDVEYRLKRLISYAQTDQVAEERLMADRLSMLDTTIAAHSDTTTTDPPATQPSLTALVVQLTKNVDSLHDEVDSLKQQIATDAQPARWIWPLYTAKATEEDKRTIEDYLHRICSKKNRGATAEIKKFLQHKQAAGLIERPQLLETEYDIICQFGYKQSLKTYKNYQA